MNFLLAGVLILCAVNLVLSAVANYQTKELLHYLDGELMDIVITVRAMEEERDLQDASVPEGTE